MKKTLSFTLWPEPPIPLTTVYYKKSAITRFIYNVASRLLEHRNLQLMKIPVASENQRVEGKIWPGYADTMIGLKRLDNLQHCIETVLREKIEGDLLEAGVWKGGASIFMRAALAVYGVTNRRVFVADSFEGLPEPDDTKYPADQGDKHHKYTPLAISKMEVEDNFRKYGLLDEQVIFLKGWFKDTLPKAPINTLAVLRLDGDMYGSTMETLESLYIKLAKGGFCIIDDYALEGCKKAVDEYRKKNNITSELKEIDWTGRYWRKD